MRRKGAADKSPSTTAISRLIELSAFGSGSTLATPLLMGLICTGML